MSISSVGGASDLSQYMATLLARLQQSEAATSASAVSTSPTSSGSPSAASSSCDPTTDTSNAATSTTDPTLSDQVIGTLVMMQMQSGDASPATAAASPSGSDPIAQAFSSLDSNGDGSISQSELESGIQNAGGTASEADTVYAALGGTDSTGISQSAFTGAAQAGGPGGAGAAGGHHHHHHGGAGSASSSDPASQLLAALDAEDGTDGTTAASGTTSASGTSSTSSTSSTSDSNLFSAIDGNGDGSISQNEFNSYLNSLQQNQGGQAASDQSTMAAFMQMVNQSYNSALGMGADTAANTMAVTA